MRGKAFKSTESCMSNGLVASRDHQIQQEFVPGDIAWTKIKNHIWWPAQVVDEKSVGSGPKKKSKDEILVRLYGSYEYLYVDPLKCNMAFEKIVKQDNVSSEEVFRRSLDMVEELSQISSRGKTKKTGRHFRDRGSSKLEEKDDAKYIKQGIPENQHISKTDSDGTSGSKSIKLHSLRRSMRRRSMRNASKVGIIERNKAEHLEYQNLGTCQYGDVIVIDEVETRPFDVEDMKHLDSKQLRQMDWEQAQQNFLNEASTGKQVKNGVSGDKVTKPEIVRKYTLRKRNHDEIKEEKHELQQLHSEEKGVSKNLFYKRTKQSGPQEQSLQEDGKEVHQNELMKHVKPGNQYARKRIESGATGGKTIKRNGLRKQKHEEVKDPKLESPISVAKQNGLQNQKHEDDKDPKLETPASAKFSETEAALDIVSSRKTKVMQTLGLIAPLGSPF
ncbi:uncharacterized protein LOC122020169 [Zingiber officinale]|uniref:uncharacterized protein LOC122020169 n=1 Tax=Zingiber officinale TaxID=94328 RepID=UPI001C4BC073|nr:uncharacterized protein LOC122020169 [Zingiber officinale]